ncbi:MAG: glycosyltransferase family 87 protein [Caulobacteraceae bacterium]
MDVQPLQEPEAGPAVLGVSRLVRAALCLCWAASVLMGAVKLMTALGRAPHRPFIFDFHTFMIAGRLAWNGRLAEAYDVMTMIGLQQQAGGQKVFMPWSYPPLFGLVMAPLSQIPILPAFCLFVLSAFGLFLLALRRLAPRSAWLVLATLAPCTIVNLASGQNGFLTGGLFALAAAAFVNRKPGQGGLAIGALAYKPHMALVWPALLAVCGRWATAAIAGLVAVALTGASFLVVGPEPFKAFLTAGAQTGRYMAAGYYPLHRMTSLYATGVSLGLPAGAALALHGAGALAAIGGVVWAGGRLPEPAQAGLAIMSTVFLSPYFYDYDQPVFGVGLALVLPELMARTTRLRLGLLLALTAASQAVGLPIARLAVHPSFGGVLLIAAFGLMLQILAQAPNRRESRALVSGPVGSLRAV